MCKTSTLTVLILLCFAPPADAEVQLARDGKAAAVIVPANWQPRPTVAIGGISLKSAGHELFAETFQGMIDESLESFGFRNTQGSHVVTYLGNKLGYGVRARSGGKDRFGALSEKQLPNPHTITEDAPLELQFVLVLPADRSEESWVSVQLRTDEGKRWTHGIAVTPSGEVVFAPAAEPRDPDRMTLPAEAGRVLDMKMELTAKSIHWFWRNHDSGKPFELVTSWGMPGPVTITRMHLDTMNHSGRGERDLASSRLDAATRDLKKYLDAATGARFEIVDCESVPGGASRIYVGDSAKVRSLAPEVDWDALGTDRIVIKTAGKDLILAGGVPRGQVYAIYTFLQDHVGIRWWAPGEMTIPKRPELSVAKLDVRYKPPFEMRVFRSEIGVMPEASGWHRLSFDLSFDYGTHSFPKFLPAKLALEHPDWFMYYRDDGDENQKYSYRHSLKSYRKTLETETERTDLPLIRQYFEILKQTRRLPGVPCLSSEGARQKITENALADYKKDHASWKYQPKIAWLLQGDGGYRCQCDACEALRQQEGSDSAGWVQLVNAVAETVEKKYPDVMVGMFAYLDTERPPKTLKPRKNVLVYQALLRRNFLDPVSSYPFHANSMKKWASMATKLFVWDYDTSFRNYYQPHPNYFVNGENMKFFEEVGVDGIFVQSAVGKATDFGAMRTWVTARMMWNPDQDQRKLMEEFATGYYGAAGPVVMQYLDAMVAAAHRKEDYWLGCYRDDTTGWLNLDDVHVALSLFDQAADAVRGDKILEQRVWMARRAIDFAWLDRYDEFKKEAEAKGIELGLPDPALVVDELAPYRNAWGSFREGPRPAEFYVYFDKFREKFPSSSKDP